MPLYIPHSEGKQHEISENGNKAKSAQMLTFTKLPYMLTRAYSSGKKTKSKQKNPNKTTKSTTTETLISNFILDLFYRWKLH